MTTRQQTITTPWAVLLLLLTCLLAVGCASEPFARQTIVPLGVTSPQQVLAKLGSELPARILTDDTVVIQAPFRDDMAVLSVVKIDRIAVSLELMGMSHTGVKLFHVAYVDGKPLVRYAAPPLADQTKVLESLATDSWHIYFDLLPELSSWHKTSWDKMTFSRKTSQGTLTYTVQRIATDKDAPPFDVLTEKTLSTWSGTKWRVRYFHYAPAADVATSTSAPSSPVKTTGASVLADLMTRESHGHRGAVKLHPTGIVLDNKTYHYRIIVKNRKWQEVSP